MAPKKAETSRAQLSHGHAMMAKFFGLYRRKPMTCSRRVRRCYPTVSLSSADGIFKAVRAPMS